MAYQEDVMTVSDAMREAVARELDAILTSPDDHLSAHEIAERILAGPIASDIARLTGERDAAFAARDEVLHGEEAEDVLAGLQVVVAARDAAEAETARLRAALEPFAKASELDAPHSWQEEFAAARAALSSQEKPDV
jgi:hypothetical protein